MMLPAACISTEPRAKIHTSIQGGCPSEDSHNAQKHGQSSSKLPVGMSSRIIFSYSFKRLVSWVSSVFMGDILAVTGDSGRGGLFGA